MKNTLYVIMILLIFLALPSVLSAQSAYRGGSGDGYAMAELKDVTLSILEETEQQSQFNIYPNPAPAGEQIWIQLLADKQATSKLEILDMTGKLLESRMITSTVSSEALELHLQAGSYLIRLSNGDNISVRKLIIL
jgi:hypothetical protein